MSSAIRETLATLARRWSAASAARAEAAAAREFWDAGAPGEPEDRYWGSQPLVRRAINRRVTGDPNRWPMEWFADRYAPTPLPLGLSVGCGTGLLERDILAKGRVLAHRGRRFLARIDRGSRAFRGGGRPRPGASPTASRTSTRSASPRSATTSCSFTDRSTTSATSSACSRRCAGRSSPAASSSWTSTWGPSRSEWNDADWGFARSAFDALPDVLKNRSELAIPLPMDDPSESVRSSRDPPGLPAPLRGPRGPAVRRQHPLVHLSLPRHRAADARTRPARCRG